MIILGIDPGTAIVGYGVIKKLMVKSPAFAPLSGASAGTQKLKVLCYGCIKTKAGLPAAERLKKIYQELKRLIRKTKPDIMAVEDIFFCKNLKTAIKVAQSCGVIILAAAQAKIPLFEYTPLQIKQAVTGFGRAEKLQVQKMVKAILALKEIPKPNDAADALACTICCAHSISYESTKI